MKLPPNNNWTQKNNTEGFGSLWASKNLDLTSKIGVTRVSPRMILNVSSSDLSNLGVLSAVEYFRTSSGFVWAAAGSRMFYSTAGPNTTFIQDATGSTPTNLSSNQTDIKVFNGKLHVTGATTSIYTLSSGGAWGTSSDSLTDSGGLHQMTYFRAQNKLYIVDDNNKSIGSLNTSDVYPDLGLQYTLEDLCDNNANIISCITSNSTRIWIGTISFTGYTYIYSWDGSQTSGPNEAYLIPTKGILSMVILNEIPHALDVEGRLWAFNGGTFVDIDRLPLDTDTWGSYFGQVVNRPVHYNGMRVVNGRINVLLNASLWDTSDTIKPNFTSGIWERDPDIGFYHKYSLGLSKSGGTINDFGAERLGDIGALGYVDVPDNEFTAGSVNGKVICGAEYYSDATNTLKGLFYNDSDDTLQKYGYLITEPIYSPEILDNYVSLYARHKKLLDADDFVALKYITEELNPTEFTIEWVSDTDFITSTDPTSYEVGNEVEIVQGPGAGKSGHITAIQEQATESNWLVSLDETFTGVSGNTAKARFDIWKKAASRSDQTVQFSKFPIGTSSAWIRLKLCMQFKGKDELKDLDLVRAVSKKSE